MTDINMEGNSSKKKYLIPLVALLICGMAFTGAAYAYSASIQTSGDLAVQSYELDIDGANTISFKDCYVQFDSTKVSNKDGVTTNYTVHLDKDKKVQDIKTVKITINKNEHNTAKFSITDVVIKCNDESAKDLKFETATTMNDAQTEATIVISVSGFVTGVPLSAYNLTLTVETQAVQA